MLKFSFDNSKWTSSNDQEVQLLEVLKSEKNQSLRSVLEEVGSLQPLLEIAKAPDAWLMRNGPLPDFVLWVTAADELEPKYDRGYVGTLFFKYTCIEWVRESNYSFVKKNGEDFTDADMHDYVMRYGFTTDSLGEVLQSKDEWERSGLCLNIQGKDIVDQSDVGKTQWLTVAVDSSYFERVSRGVTLQFRIPLKRCVTLNDQLLDKLGRVDVMSVTMKNGSVNRQRATKLIEKRLKQGKLHVAKSALDELFQSKLQIHGEELMSVTAFGETKSTRADRSLILNSKGIQSKSRLQLGSLQNLYAEDVLETRTLRFLSLLKSLGFQLLRTGSHFGVPSPDESSNVKEIGYVRDGKFCVNGRMVKNQTEEMCETNIWSMVGMDYVLLPGRNYFLVNFGPFVLCVVE